MVDNQTSHRGAKALDIIRQLTKQRRMLAGVGDRTLLDVVLARVYHLCQSWVPCYGRDTDLAAEERQRTSTFLSRTADSARGCQAAASATFGRRCMLAERSSLPSGRNGTLVA